MTKRPCLQRGCPALTTATRCPTHEAEHQRRRNQSPTRTTRYDPAHRQAAQALLAHGPWPCHWQTIGICTHVATQADHVPADTPGAINIDGVTYVRSCRPCNSGRARRDTGRA